MPSWRFFGIGELGRRLAAAFVGVVLATLAFSYLIENATVEPGVSAFIKQQQADLASAMAIAATIAYDPGRDPVWWKEDLSPITRLTSSEDAAIQVTAMNGKVIFSSPAFPDIALNPGSPG